MALSLPLAQPCLSCPRWVSPVSLLGIQALLYPRPSSLQTHGSCQGCRPVQRACTILLGDWDGDDPVSWGGAIPSPNPWESLKGPQVLALTLGRELWAGLPTCEGHHPGERHWGTQEVRVAAGPPPPSPCTWTSSWAERAGLARSRRPHWGSWCHQPSCLWPVRGPKGCWLWRGWGLWGRSESKGERQHLAGATGHGH